MLQRPTDRSIFQNAWVVDDCEASCNKWINELGIGPFYVGDYDVDVDYRGERQHLKMSIAIAQAGPVQIELIQPNIDRCVYRDSVTKGSDGFHHMCVWTHDIDADTEYFQSLGYPVATQGTIGDIEFAYYDTRPLMGCMLEVATPSESLLKQSYSIKEAAANWDGKDPIRYNQVRFDE